jgi:FeS assembly SUF system protein
MFSFFSKRAKPEAQSPSASGSGAAAAVADPAEPAAPVAAATPAPDVTPAEPAPVMNGDLNVGALLEVPAAAAAAAAAIGPVDADRTDILKPAIVDAISTVFDPEIPVNIYELGLIYEILADADSRVLVRMTLTSPACPSAQQLPSEVRYKVKAIAGVTECTVDIVWEPPWTKDMMSEAARLSLGMF